MKYNEKEEMFFKRMADLFAEKDGGLLRKELAELSEYPEYPSSLDRRVKNKITGLKLRRMGFMLMPAAACLIIFAVYFSNPSIKDGAMNSPTDSSAGNASHMSEKSDIEFLSARLPEGYELTSVDRDINKTIYYVASNDNNNIVITTEEATGVMLENEAFQEIYVNQTPVYVLVKNDFNVLTYEKDNIIYTMTDRYNYRDLIELSRNFI